MKNIKGFTLLELLITIVLLALTSIAMYEAYMGQRKIHQANEEMAAMQQNLRAAMYYLENDIKKAGLDPLRVSGGGAGAGIVVADVSTIQFTLDITGGENDGIDNNYNNLIDDATEWYDGSTDDAGENITYLLYDSGADGDLDLGRRVGAGTNQPVADNIDAFDIVYLDSNGTVLGPTPLTAAQMRNVKSFQITLVVRAERPDPDYTNSDSYFNRQGTLIFTAPNDNFRRISMTTDLMGRNLGL